MIFEDMDRVGDPHRGLYRFGARDGSTRRYRVWAGLVDVTTERSLQIVWQVRRSARRRVRSHRSLTLAMEGRGGWGVVESGRALVSFAEVQTGWPTRSDALLPLRLLREPDLAEAIATLLEGGRRAGVGPGLWQRPRTVHVAARRYGELLAVDVKGVEPARLELGPGEVAEAGILSAQWPPVIDVGSVEDWQFFEPSLAPASWADAAIRLREALSAQA
jgi:hypothetical protein